MSTKIYNAYKVKNLTIFQLIELFKKMKTKYLNDCIEKFIKYHIVDEFENKVSLMDEIKKQTRLGYKNPLNINADAVIYSDSNNQLYAQFFGLNLSEYNDYVDNKYFEDYHYQNQSDMSNYDWNKEKWEFMSKERQDELEKDWEERQEKWKELLPDEDDIPSHNGLVFTFGKDDWFDLYYIAENVFSDKENKEKMEDK